MIRLMKNSFARPRILAAALFAVIFLIGPEALAQATDGQTETKNLPVAWVQYDYTPTPFTVLTLVVGYVATGLIGLFGLLILWRIHERTIDISRLIAEESGHASLSRFQFLIFTFVISLSLLLVIVGDLEHGPRFPAEIPLGIYALLGISAASYVFSKGIQKDITMTEKQIEAAGGAAGPEDPLKPRVGAGNENAG